MNTDRVMTVELKDPTTGKVTVHWINKEEFLAQLRFLKGEKRPQVQEEGLMFHPDRSHETPELRQAVIDAIRGINIK